MDRIGGDLGALGGSTGAVIDSMGQPLISTDVTGGQSYILGPTMLRAIVGGVANGDFAKPPADVDAVIDTGDNALPYWDWVDTSGGRITAQVVADSGQASGNVIRFTVVGNGSASGTAYLERYVSVLGSLAQTLTYQPRATFFNPVGGTALTSKVSLDVTAQYFTVAGSAVGSAVTSYIWANAATSAYELQANPNTTGVVPSNAALLRLQIGADFTSTLNGTVTFDLAEVRIDYGYPQLMVTDGGNPSTYGYGVLYLADGVMWLRANELGTAGSNPSVVLDAKTGNISIDASYSGAAAPVTGDIYLNTKTGGTAHFSDNQITTKRNYTGSRTSLSASDPTSPGVALDGTDGFLWASRDNITAADEAIGYFTSSYYNGSLRMIRFLRRITAAGTALTSTGYISVANNATDAPAFAAGSDHRLKDNVRDADDELDFAAIISALRPVLYREKEVDQDGKLGFIAHEVQAVIPEAVEGEKDAVDPETGEPIYQSLKQGVFVAYLVGAVRELTRRVEELEAAANP